MKRWRSIAVPSLAAFTVVAFAGMSCDKSETERGDRTASVQCIDDEVPVRLMAPTVASLVMIERFDRVEAEFGARPDASGNEAHDCQRLVIDDQGKQKYTKLMTIWAFSPLIPEYSSPTLVAGIVAGENYDSLGIQTGKNCLLLRGNIGDDTGASWYAWIIPIAPIDSDKKCATEKPETAGRDSLKVWRSAAPGMIARGARWETTETRNFIGIDCLGRWCVIGVDVAGQRPTDLISEHRAEGDEQWLAVKEGNGVKPSFLRGSITPVKDLGAFSKDTMQFIDWRHVATMRFSYGTPKAFESYAKKLRLPVAMLRKDSVLVFLRRDSLRTWQFRYGESSDSGRIAPADVYGVGASPGHGSVRWRWSDADEGVWVPCPMGCCGDDGCLTPDCQKKAREAGVANADTDSPAHEAGGVGRRGRLASLLGIFKSRVRLAQAG